MRFMTHFLLGHVVGRDRVDRVGVDHFVNYHKVPPVLVSPNTTGRPEDG